MEGAPTQDDPLPTPRPSLGRGRTPALAAGVLGLLAVVALASRGRRLPGGEGTGRAPSAAFWDYLFTLTLAAGVIAAGVAVWAIATVRGSGEALPRRRKGFGFVSFAVLMLFVVVALLLVRKLDSDGISGGQPAVSVPSLPGALAPTSSGEQPYDPTFRWLPIVVLGSLGVLTAAFFTARARLRRNLAAEGGDEAFVEELASLLEDTLDDLRAEPDPRVAVIAAYARMERALGAYGLGRRRSEAPLEYLDRIAPDLLESRPSARRLVFELTHLYERAKFSPHRIDAEMKEEAIATLGALRNDLAEESA